MLCLNSSKVVIASKQSLPLNSGHLHPDAAGFHKLHQCSEPGVAEPGSVQGVAGG